MLDVGCATGYLAERLAARGCAVVGIEQDHAAAAAARAGGLEVLEGSAEDPAVLAAALARGPFDHVLCGDVLEHLADPWRVLAALGEAAPRATISLPNVAHWTGRRAVLAGRFPREAHGLFDATHLRWFTRRSARELATGAGWRVASEAFTPAPLPLQAHVAALRRLEPLALRARPELFALQVVLELTRPAP